MAVGDYMASPQTENGFTSIANELMEAMPQYKFNGTQFRILFVVLRYTYGFQRKSHELSLTFLANKTGIHKHQIKRELDILIQNNVLVEASAPTFNKTRSICLNKNYEEWQISRQSANSLTVNEKDDHTVSENAYPTVSENAYQLKKVFKENTKESNRANAQEKKDELEKQVSEIWQAYPRKKGKDRAVKSIPKIIKEYGFEKLLEAVNRYRKEIEIKKTEMQFIQHGSTFFNSGYKDYIGDDYIPIDIQDYKPNKSNSRTIKIADF
jgi:phage replication O-like protein O